MAEESLIEFPCDFPIKIMAAKQDGLAQSILDLVRRHDPAFDGATMEMRASSSGNYLSFTCTVRATSRTQLDALYRDLSGQPWVKVVL
jgi:putative lipoic acid-binding regulatory protein